MAVSSSARSSNLKRPHPTSHTPTHSTYASLWHILMLLLTTWTTLVWRNLSYDAFPGRDAWKQWKDAGDALMMLSKRPLAVCRSIQPGVDTTLQGRCTSTRSAWVALLDWTGSYCGTLDTPQLCCFDQYLAIMVVCLCVVVTSGCNNWNRCEAEEGSRV